MESNQNSLLRNNFCRNCKEFFDRITNSMPLFIKFVLFITLILYLINIFIPFISLIFANIPYYTIYYFNLWRLITTSFITTNILSIIFSIYFWYQEAVKLEREIGTVKYMLIFLMNSFCIQLMYTLIMFLFSLIIRSQTILKLKITNSGVRNEGLWPILLCDLTLLCLSNPEEPQKFYFFPFSLKAKYYPIFLFVFFTVLSGFRIDLEVLCGIGFGFLFHYYLKNKLLLSNNFATKIENSFLFRWMKKKKGFIYIGGVRLPELKNNLENIRNISISERRGIAQGGFKAFKGKGLAVGGEEENKVNENTNETNDVNISSTHEINSGDNSLNLNSSEPKP